MEAHGDEKIGLRRDILVPDVRNYVRSTVAYPTHRRTFLLATVPSASSASVDPSTSFDHLHNSKYLDRTPENFLNKSTIQKSISRSIWKINLNLQNPKKWLIYPNSLHAYRSLHSDSFSSLDQFRLKLQQRNLLMYLIHCCSLCVDFLSCLWPQVLPCSKVAWSEQKM